MATVVTSVIAPSGSDHGTGLPVYTTLSAWEQAAPADLVATDTVWKGEMYDEGVYEYNQVSPVNFAAVCDATRYFWLTTAAGQSFRDKPDALENPLRYDPTKGVSIRCYGSYAAGFVTNSGGRSLVENLQILWDSTGGYTSVTFSGNFRNCIFESKSNSRYILENAARPVNCVFFNSGNATASNQGPVVQACTFARPVDLAAGGVGFSTYAGYYASISNSAVFGYQTNFAGSVGSYPGTGKNASNTPAPGAGSLSDLVYADQFTDVNLATFDFRPLSTGSLPGAAGAADGVEGNLDLLGTNGVDIVGELRDLVAPTVGAREVGGGGSAPTYDQGFDFRGTQSWATDVDPNCWMASPGQYGGVQFAYPWTTPQNNVCGWFKDTSENTFEFLAASDTTRYGAELSGYMATRNGRRHNMQIDLPSPGDYDIRLALGNVDGAAGIVTSVYDDTTQLYSVQQMSPGAGVYDAMGTFFAPADWAAGNQPRRITMTTTKLIIGLGNAGFYDYGGLMAYLRVTQVSGGTEPPETTGGLAATESADVAAFSGSSSKVGSISATELRDTAAFAGTIIPSFSTGTLAATEVRDVFASAGDTNPPDTIAGGLAVTEPRDAAAFSGTKTYFGSVDASERRDVAAFQGTIIPSFSSGTLAATETRDTFASAGDVNDPNTKTGGLAYTEVRDVAAFAGVKTYYGTLAVTEQRDRAAFQGLAIKIISGSMAATEFRDLAAFTDKIEEGNVSNTIALRDGNTGLGVSPEDSWDSGAPRGNDGVNIPVALGQAPTPTNFQNNAGTQRQARLVLAPADTPAGTDVIPGFASYVDVKAGEWVWCVSRTNIVAEKDNPLGQGDTAPVGSSASTLGNPGPAPVPSITLTIPDAPDIYAFEGTVVHPTPPEE